MNDDLRQRVFLPIMMPLAVMVGFIGFAFALSRVLLAVPEAAATTIALAVAAYILVVAALVAAKPMITSRALAVGVTVACVAVLAAGTLAGAAGMRELHAEEEAAAGEGGEGEAPTGESAGNAFVAIDIEFEAAPAQLPAGETTIELINEGATVHNVLIDDLDPDEPVVEAQPGETQSAQVQLEPGTYRYHCNVPGHEPTMNGEFTVPS